MNELDKWMTVAGALAIAVLLIGAWIALAWWAGRWVSREKKPDNPSFPAASCAHEWRSVAAPFGRQCRKCSTVEFQTDKDGNFPDGFREYFDYIKARDAERFRLEVERVRKNYNEGKTEDARQAMDRTADQTPKPPGALPDLNAPGHHHHND